MSRGSVEFSIVVTTFERPHLLREALASILCQSTQDWECIVVDDASSQPVSTHDLPDSRFRLVRNEKNLGLAASRNIGIDVAGGSALMFLDDDDIFLPNRIQLAAQALERAPIGICWSAPMQRPPTRQRILDGCVHDVILDSTSPSLGATAVKREWMVEFDPTYRASQDLEWWLRISRHAELATSAEFGHLVRTHQGMRNGNGVAERIRCSERLMTDYAEYFRAHRRAAAFRHFRIARMHELLGNDEGARRHFRRSLGIRPSTHAAVGLSRTLLRRVGG